MSMKKVRMKWGLIALCFVMAASFAGATSTCASLVTIDVGSIGSCTVAIGSYTYTFSNFQQQDTAFSTGSTADVFLTNVAVSGGEILLTFNPNEQAGGVTDIHFGYEVSVTNSAGAPVVGIFGSDLSIPMADTGTAITEEDCSNQPSFVDGSGCTTLGTLGVNQAGNLLISSNTYAGQSTIWVWKDLEITGSLGHDSAFTESLATPEPMTFSLMGVGLLGIGLLGRRLRK